MLTAIATINKTLQKNRLITEAVLYGTVSVFVSHSKIETTMTDKQFNALFRRRMDAYVRANDREIRSFASIPYGYGSRAYHRFKIASDKSGEIRVKLSEMAATGRIDPALLREAVSRRILCEDILQTVSR